MESVCFSIVLSLIVCTWFVLRSKLCSHNSSTKFPPGPYSFPIIGNIIQIVPNPHKSLEKLSKIHGPIMSIKLGKKTLVVISSPQIAKRALVSHDNTLSLHRPIPVAAQAHSHDKISVAFLHAGTQWRKLRRICKEQMFSKSRLDASRGLRGEKLCQLRDYVLKCFATHRAVNIQEAAYITTLNLMSNTLFSVDFARFDSSSGQELKGIVEEVITTLSAPNVADYFSFLEAIDPQGIKRRADVCVGKLLAMFEEIINERLKSREEALTFGSNYQRKSDMLEILLDLSQGNEYDLSYNEIKHLLLDLFLGGTDTTSNTVDWAMTELLLNPKKMSNLKNELNAIVGKSTKHVEESDILRLPYLQAVIKEVFRFHPPAPFLIPHKAESDIEINGYTIPKNTQVIVNVWAIGRDSKIWSNSGSFEPERFLGLKINVKGQDFELIPFGSGRRICPGMPLAHCMVHLMVATLVHNFDWKLGEELINTDEKFGLSLRRLVPLTFVPIKLCTT